MKILSIYPYTHISSAALLINGKIVSAAQEERFNRKKMSTDFPINAINWCLNDNGLNFKDIDLIVVPWNPQKNINNVSMRWVNQLRWRGEMLTNIPATLMRMINEKESNSMSMSWGKNKLMFIDHHLCHAAFGFFQSSFKNADILTIDGHGEAETCFLGTAKNNKIKKLDSVQYPHSIGLFYGTFTDFLGFKPDSDEWKVMALSSYATKKNKYDQLISKIYNLKGSYFELDLSYFDFYTFDRKKNFFSNKFIELFGIQRLENDKIKKEHYAIAGAMQRHFEKIAIHLIKCLKKKGASDNLIIGGGAAMNCVFNGKLDKLKIYKNSHISYAPDDSGVSIGAALYAYHQFSKKSFARKEITSCYYGPEYSAKKIKKTLDQCKVNYLKPKNLEKYVAKKISEKKLVGWFQGKMEFGHRALGNRSILADPRDKKIKDIINMAVKFREGFRPFAPAILKEKTSDIMEMPKHRNVFFMERAYKFKKKWSNTLKGVAHVDNTGRVQTVTKESNIKFYKLIKEFEHITGIPVLLNTSFNLNGEPIVMSPSDAIRTFYSCGLDILVIGDFVIEKN
jgi:carbamoyltransferase